MVTKSRRKFAAIPREKEGQVRRSEKKATDIQADTLTNPTQTKKEVGQTKGQVSY